ncbi:hypothetical protein QEN19_000148 [Hanseniaspora menglaensis]
MNSSNEEPVFYIAGNATKVKYTRPKFPSLYFPIKTNNKNSNSKYALNFSTSYIYYVTDIWQFTIYWCLILYPSAYIISGIITLYNLLHVRKRIFTKQRNKHNNNKNSSNSDVNISYELDPRTSEPSISETLKLNSSVMNSGIYYFLLLIYLLLYPIIGLIYGAINGTVIGFLLGVMYRSGLFSMSTWVPLCVSCCSLLYTILSSYKLFGYAM